MNFVYLLATNTGASNNISKVIITLLIIVIIALLVKMIKTNKSSSELNNTSRNSNNMNDNSDGTYSNSRTSKTKAYQSNDDTIGTASSKEENIDPQILAAIIAVVKEDASQVIGDEFKIVSIKQIN